MAHVFSGASHLTRNKVGGQKGQIFNTVTYGDPKDALESVK